MHLVSCIPFQVYRWSEHKQWQPIVEYLDDQWPQVQCVHILSKDPEDDIQTKVDGELVCFVLYFFFLFTQV